MTPNTTPLRSVAAEKAAEDLAKKALKLGFGSAMVKLKGVGNNKQYVITFHTATNSPPISDSQIQLPSLISGKHSLNRFGLPKTAAVGTLSGVWLRQG